MSNSDAIPVIDVEAIHGADEGRLIQLAREFFSAYATTGFSYIVNHGVAEKLVDQVFAASKRFHDLPRETKMAVELNHNHRGFIPINTSTDVNSQLADVKHPNQSESFMVMREDAPGSAPVRAGEYLAGPNQWPELDGFRDHVMAYNAEMTGLAQKLVNIVKLALNTDETFVDHFRTPTTWLRLLYYPANDLQDAQSLEQRGVFGSAPHTDFGCLTLLAQDSVGGLQVQTTNKQWIDVPKLPGSFVVNAGDMLQRWSNGLLRSTPHRVINVSGKARYSCPFFFDPGVRTTVEPLQSCITSDRAAQYQSIVFEDFLRNELESGYKHNKPENSD